MLSIANQLRPAIGERRLSLTYYRTRADIPQSSLHHEVYRLEAAWPHQQNAFSGQVAAILQALR